ncbi:hypothetical protein AtubIFM55763_001879 [Aspergillus tubingensis]|nr:hypothetical protein AtubIFM55763_001879 [Aspergillus tubingensis]
MVIYNVSVGLTKISILLFYRRIFSINKAFLFCNWVVTGLSAGACIAAVSGLIFSTNPVDAQWKFWEPSTTIHNKSFWIAMGAVNILLDVIILILPQPVVWQLKQTRRCRILLSLVFSVGGFWKSGFGALGSVRYHAVGSRQKVYNDIEAASPKRANNYWGDVAQVHAYTKLQGY